MDGGQDRILVQAEEAALAAQVTDQMIGVDQAQAAQDTQKGQLFGEQRGQQQGTDDQNVGDRIDPTQFLGRIRRHPEPRQQIGQDKQAKNDIDPVQQRRLGDRSRQNEIADRDRVEGNQAIAELLRSLAAAPIEQPNVSMKAIEHRVSHLAASGARDILQPSSLRMHRAVLSSRSRLW
jgi:hypothetical protein